MANYRAPVVRAAKAGFTTAPNAPRRPAKGGTQPRPARPDDLILRSVSLPQWQDDLLRRLAYENRFSKNDLIRAALASNLDEWAGVERGTFVSEVRRGVVRPRS